MIKVKRIKKKVYEVIATQRKVSVRGRTKHKALKKLARKLDFMDFMDRFKSFFKKSLRNK